MSIFPDDSERVTDVHDRATEVEELARRAAASQRKPAGPVATGRCLYCDEQLDDGQRWCGAHCRDEWQKEQVRK